MCSRDCIPEDHQHHPVLHLFLLALVGFHLPLSRPFLLLSQTILHFISFQIWSRSDSMISLPCHTLRTFSNRRGELLQLEHLSQGDTFGHQSHHTFQSADLTSKPPGETTRSLKSGRVVPSSSHTNSKNFHALPSQPRLCSILFHPSKCGSRLSSVLFHCCVHPCHDVI